MTFQNGVEEQLPTLSSGRLRVVRAFFAFTMVCSLIPAGVLFISDPLWAVGAAAIIGTTLLGWWLAGVLHRQGASANWLVSVGLLNLLLVCPELTLRAVGYRHETGVEFGYPRPHEMLNFVPDEQVFWKLPPDTDKTNSLGFPGPEVAVPKPPNVTRLLFLGDSCTWHGYPWEVEKILQSRQTHLGPKFESVVLAVPGYSSYQGRVLAEQYGRDFDPDVVVAYYGWNDHWLAYGATDEEKGVAAGKGRRISRPSFMQQVLHRLRLLQGIAHLAELTSDRDAGPARLRVPIEQFRANLVRIGRLFHEEHVPVVFVTAPSAHASRGVPARLIDLGFVADPETAIRLHAEYCEAVRQVCYENGWHLLDLARKYDREPNLDALFMPDGIHFQKSWLPRVAQDVVEFLTMRRLVSP